ncbi:MAG TPA: hydrolase [Planctomycetota bacterium]|nr:hydrolase [Planctomycetota bacterium]
MSPASALFRPRSEEAVRLPAAGLELEGRLGLPPTPRGLILLPQAASANRFGLRLGELARALRLAGYATLIADLLSEEEDRHYARRFEVPLLADRLLRVSTSLRAWREEWELGLGVLATSSVAAAALRAARDGSLDPGAWVFWEARLDLAPDLVSEISVPTLLLSGARNVTLTRLHAEAYPRLTAPKDLLVLPGAMCLLEEGAARAELVRCSADWFGRFLGSRPDRRGVEEFDGL